MTSLTPLKPLTPLAPPDTPGTPWHLLPPLTPSTQVGEMCPEVITDSGVHIILRTK